MPSIARWKGRIPAGQVSDALCSTMDLFPTIAHLAGAGLPGDREIDGINIWPVLRGDKNGRGHDILYYYNGITLEAVRDEKWKLHLPREQHCKVYWSNGNLGGFTSLDKPALFNLETDIEEKSDVADEYPVVVERLLDHAEKAREELGDWNRWGTDQKSLLDYSGNPNSPRRDK